MMGRGSVSEFYDSQVHHGHTKRKGRSKHTPQRCSDACPLDGSSQLKLYCINEESEMKIYLHRD